MRTSYPTPSFSDGYQYKLVDSTFIHAIHLARSSGNWTYNLGVSFQSNQDEIKWYIVNDPKALYKKLTDPKQSPGFTFNNSVKGKQYTTTQVNELKGYVDCTNYAHAPKKVKPFCGHTDHTEDGIDPPKYNKNTSPEAIRLLEAWKAQLNAKVTPKGFAIPRIDPTPLPTAPVYTGQSGYGSLLEVCQRVGESSCISYLAMGYNRTDKNFIVYFALKTKPHDVLAFFTDNASVYRDWTSATSLGRFYNRSIRFQQDVFSVRGAAKA